MQTNVLNLEQPSKERDNGPEVTPASVERLVSIMGTQARAAKKLGCSPNHISKSLKKKKIPLVYELAAERVIARDYTKAPEPDPQALISAPAHVLKTVEAVVTGAGGQFKQI